jgi:hypothetical protein
VIHTSILSESESHVIPVGFSLWFVGVPFSGGEIFSPTAASEVPFLRGDLDLDLSIGMTMNEASW